MFIINCPYCGPRDQAEFAYGGQAHISRPKNASDLTDAQWADFVFFRSNTKGLFAERWNHAGGCRKWFNAIRDTSTDKFVTTYPIGATANHDTNPDQEGIDRLSTKLETPSGEPEIGSGNDGTRVRLDRNLSQTEDK